MKMTFCFLIASITLASFAQTGSAQDQSFKFREIQAAKEFYDAGYYGKAGSLLDILTRDKDLKLAEEAWKLKAELFGNVFVPPEHIPAVMDDFKFFAKKNKKGVSLKEIENTLNAKSSDFKSKVKDNEDNIVLLFGDSCIVNFAPDSTFYFTFEKSFTGKDQKEHRISLGFSGKMKIYQPYGDMQDEWGSTGLLINTDGNIIIEVDNKPAFSYNSPLSLKQYPEYVLRPVTKYGFTQEQTFIREDDAAANSRLAFEIGDNMIISDLNIKLLFGKMHELVPYYSDSKERVFPDKFDSKAFVELKLIHTEN